MAGTEKVKLLELSQVAPPPRSVAAATLPLTFIDSFFLKRPDIRRILFYELSPPDNTTHHFLNLILPNLKRSLSLALQLFFPLAAKLTQSSSGSSTDYEIRYSDGDSVSLAVVESDADFDLLRANYPRPFSELHPLIPDLDPPNSLLALQFTVFPNAGFSIAYRVSHVLADGSSLTHFMKSWASICRSGDISAVANLPSYDRTPLGHLDSLKRSLMEEELLKANANQSPPAGGVRATFTLTRSDIESLSQSLIAQAQRNRPSADTSHFTRFVVACAHAWVCLLRARGGEDNDDDDDSHLEGKTATLFCPVDLRARLCPEIPPTYFGNCIGACFAEASLSELLAEDGFWAASEAMGTAIRSYVGGGGMKDAESWEWSSRMKGSGRIAAVGASPKFRVYDTDFGWGRPKKTELIPTQVSRVIYMGDSREEEGGVDVSVVLGDEQEMALFASLFQQGLEKSTTSSGTTETNL
ncbi:hypothetical protein ACLOJK_013168 [Asimina triloba]